MNLSLSAMVWFILFLIRFAHSADEVLKEFAGTAMTVNGFLSAELLGDSQLKYSTG